MTKFTTDCYDPKYQKPYEDQQKYHFQSYHLQELSSLLPSNLLEYMKLNNPEKSKTEENI